MNLQSALSRLIKPFSILIIVLILYGLTGFFLFPAILSAKLPEVIEEATGRKSSIKAIEFNPFLLKLKLREFSLQEANGQPFAGFDQFYIDLNAFRSIGNAALVVDEVLLIKPSVRIVRLESGQFNFSGLVKSQTETREEPEDGGLFPVIVDKTSLQEGTLEWLDSSQPESVQEKINPVNLEIKALSTQSDEAFPLHFSCALGSGGRLDWQGSASIQKQSSSGHIKLNDFNLHRIQELALKEALAFDLAGNELVEFDYQVVHSDKGLDASIDKSRIELKDLAFSEKASNGLNLKSASIVLESSYKASLIGEQWKFAAEKTRLAVKTLQLAGIKNSKALVDVPEAVLEAAFQADNADKNIGLTFVGDNFSVRNFALSESGKSDALFKLSEFTVRSVNLDLAKQNVQIDSVSATTGATKAWLDAEGRFNYALLFADESPVAAGKEANAENKPAKPADAPAMPWHFNVNSVALNDFSLAFEDRTHKNWLKLNANPIDIKLSNISNKNGQKIPLHFTTGINQKGSIKIDGDVVIDPFSTRLQLAIDNIELERFQPYVEPYARLDILDGRFNADGDVAVALKDKDGLDAKFKGKTSIADFLTRDQILHRDFVKWKNLSLQDIDVDLLANRYTAKQLLIKQPYARVTVKKDKTVNVSDVFKSNKSKVATAKAEPKKAVQAKSSAHAKPYFKLAKIQIVDAQSDFADLSLILPFAAPINKLNGGASGISSDPKSSVKVSLKGYAFDLSPVDISGDISPHLGDFNIEMNFMGMPMPLVSPYMAQFAGYKVEKGKLTLGLKYQVEKSQLSASNNILIDQFELGEKVENPNAVSLPLDLAVALLKDANGKIKLDVPITGSLEDPKFSVGGIIADALLNVITKIVMSPFTAIASLMGSEENPDVVSFAPGKAGLDPAQTRKLDALAKALYDRPILNIEIKGAAFKDQDWPALREAALLDQLKKMKADETNKTDGKKILAEYVELSDNDYKRLLADKFIEQFPQLADRTLLGKPRLIVQEAGDFYAVAKEKLAQAIKADPHRLADLASERARNIAKFIVQQRGIPQSRVFILDPAIDPPREKTQEVISFLSLKTG